MTPAVDLHQDPPTDTRPRRRRTFGRGPRLLAALLVVLAVMVAAVAIAVFNAGRVPVDRTFSPPKATPSLSSPLLPVSYWERGFLDTWDHELSESLPQSRSSDSWDHYELSYDIDSNTAMFRATGQTRYLDRALLYVNNVVASARPSSSLRTSQYRDGYLGWVSNQQGLDRPGIEVPLYESYFWRYATTMLRVMRLTPAVYNDPNYRAQYDRLLAFAEVNVFEKWFSRGANDNIYRSATHLAAHWATISLNLSLITEDAGRRAQYSGVVDNIDLHLPNYDASLRGQLIRNPVDGSAYFWDDDWGSFRRPGQDVSHGNGVISYVVEARDHGDRWTAADMERFSELLVAVIWPREGVFRDAVDGSGTGNGWFSDGFVKLGRYSPAVQQRLEHHTVVNSQFMANMALNARILAQGQPHD